MTPIEKQIQKKIEEVGTPLRDWDIQINFGIKTGFNDAFIIDTATRDRLIQEDSRSAEVIRPILRGKDIERYTYLNSDKWIIIIPFGYTNQYKGNLEAEDFIQSQYPAVYHHFLSVHEEYLHDPKKQKKSKGLIHRDDMGDYWWELRSCSYMEDFSKPKIVWKRTGSILRFAYDETGTYSLDSTCFATGSGIKYLTAILNSKMGKYLLKDSPRTGVGDLLISVQALKPIRVPKPDEDTQKSILSLLDGILTLCASNKDYTLQEEKLDELIYSLYGLIQAEKEYVNQYVLSHGF